ncbi:MAG: hypothetical protein ACKVHP_04650 [Verrucomicrobiales bacterium]
MLTLAVSQETESLPFGKEFPNLDGFARGLSGKQKPFIEMDVPREEVVGFAVYTVSKGALKMTAQLFPLKEGESREVRLETKGADGAWKEIAKQEVIELGWSAHFRVENWDASKTVPYRVRHGVKAMFEGSIRRDPTDQDVIVVGNMSCNSSRTGGPRARIVENLKIQDPDVLFFAGDQSYHHTQHTAGWLEFGLQFREIMKDRPVITIPDDHDVGQANIWGENGKKASTSAGPTGGYFYPPKYVNMVQRQQTWHLPDPYEAKSIAQGISVYYTRLRVGGVDFAILEDRKFKSGPEGKIPKMGPRPDHINDPKYDRKSVDVKGLVLLGERQLEFLHAWGQDWEGAELKAVLSQTAFCGAVHIHGQPDNRLLADLDSNGWPQTGRNNALKEIRRAWAPHLCGDQHLAVAVKHGIDAFGDGPYAFTSPAIVNTIYGRWWHPLDEKAGNHAVPNSPLSWTGDYEDGLGNKVTMLAYANPEDRKDQLKRADGYGVVRFDKKASTVTFECWPRFADLAEGDNAQFPGWPMTVKMSDNDGRRVVGKLPVVQVDGVERPVVQVIHEESGELLYTVRAAAGFEPPVYAPGNYTVKAGKDRADTVVLSGYEISKL